LLPVSRVTDAFTYTKINLTGGLDELADFKGISQGFFRFDTLIESNSIEEVLGIWYQVVARMVKTLMMGAVTFILFYISLYEDV
jgi:hypothetical protein